MLGSLRFCDVNRAAIQQTLLAFKCMGYLIFILYGIRVTVSKVLQMAVEFGYLDRNLAHGFQVGG